MRTWSNPSLLRGPQVALVMSQAEFRRAVRSTGHTDSSDLDSEFCPSNCRACTTTFLLDGVMTSVVGLSPDAFEGDQIDVASMLCHEAVHVWQQFVQNTCLTPDHRASWGVEAEAYGIQNIARELMTTYAARYAAHHGGKP